jgi:hypothetical protein
MGFHFGPIQINIGPAQAHTQYKHVNPSATTFISLRTSDLVFLWLGFWEGSVEQSQKPWLVSLLIDFGFSLFKHLESAFLVLLNQKNK